MHRRKRAYSPSTSRTDTSSPSCYPESDNGIFPARSHQDHSCPGLHPSPVSPRCSRRHAAGITRRCHLGKCSTPARRCRNLRGGAAPTTRINLSFAVTSVIQAVIFRYRQGCQLDGLASSWRRVGIEAGIGDAGVPAGRRWAEECS